MEKDKKGCERITKEAVKRKASRRNEFGLVAFFPETIKSLGCSTPSTLMPTGMRVIDPKFVKGCRKLKKTKHCTIPSNLGER